MRCRHQEGYLYRKGDSWFVRFYDHVVQKDESIKRVQVSKKLASVVECRTKAGARRLADELLEPLNDGTATAAGTMSLSQFFDKSYLPYVLEQKRPSTVKGYRDVWGDHLRARCGEYRVRDFRTLDGQRLMNEIARKSDLSRTTLKHVKSVLSGVFTYAKQSGVLNTINPMQGVGIPRSREPLDTYAYSLEEITKIMAVLPERATCQVATAAFTGMRLSELKGLRWENYDGKELHVTQSIWRGIVSDPKTRKSRAAVPVIEPLARLLERHRVETGNPTSGWIFIQNFEYLARRVIRPVLQHAGLKWHGWHAFRRGLATNLYRLGVPDKTIQAILRHSNLSTTMNVYVKTVSADSTSAMAHLERVCTSMQRAENDTEQIVM